MTFDHITEPDSSRCWCAPEVHEIVDFIVDKRGEEVGVQIDRLFFHHDEAMRPRRNGRPRRPNFLHR